MTLFAGICSRNPRRRVDPRDCDRLRALISRAPDLPVEVFARPAFYLVAADVGAYGRPARAVDDDGRITVVAGEPLLGPGPSRRDADVATLHAAFVAGDEQPFATAAGVFCAVHYDPAAASVTLAADRLGVRPLYYWIDQDWVVFATSFRVLEESERVPKRLDLRGVTERLAFGYSLGRRTPYADVSVLLSAEQVRVTETHVTSTTAWRWDRVPVSRAPLAELAVEARRRFWTAVERRLAGDRATITFLSGGLDSRSIVTVLRDLSAKVYSFNFASGASQDRYLGGLFARAAGTTHTEYPRPIEAGPRVALLLADALRDAGARVAAERPRLVWSGDGGSVGLGHVYLTEDMVRHARAGRRDLVIRDFLPKPPLVARLMTSRGAADLLRLPARGLGDELDAIEADDPGRGVYLFLMHNDQRRHLAAHFEDIDLHRMEFHLPFFDGPFLELVMSVPVDACVGHGFYMSWLSGFPEVVRSTPWQTYPGHVPCPLPIPAELRYQWDQRQPDLLRHRRRDALRQGEDALARRNFPSAYWRRDLTALAYALLRARLRDTAAAVSQVATFAEYWRRCGGRVA